MHYKIPYKNHQFNSQLLSWLHVRPLRSEPPLERRPASGLNALAYEGSAVVELRAEGEGDAPRGGEGVVKGWLRLVKGW